MDSSWARMRQVTATIRSCSSFSRRCSQIRQLIAGAKLGSMEHIHGLGIRVGQLYERYSKDILDALLPHLKYPEDGPPKECGPTYTSMSALTQINMWHTAHGGRNGLPSSLSRIVAASDDCILWAKELLETLVLNPEIRGKPQLPTHTVVSWFIYSLFKTPTKIFTTLAKRQHTLDLAIQFWVASCDGSPIIYSGGRHPDLSHDCAIGMVYQIAAENPRGLADAIMCGRVCSPEHFLKQSVERLHSLAAIDKIKHVSGSAPPLGVEKANFKCVVTVVHLLTECEPQLEALATEKRFYKHCTQSLVSLLERLIGRPPQASPARPGHPIADARKTQTLEVLDLVDRILNDTTNTSAQVVRKMKAALDGGLLALLGMSLRVIRDGEPRFDALLQSVIQYAIYPSVVTVITRDFPTAILPGVALLSRTSDRRSQMLAVMDQLKPIMQMRSKKRQGPLCDNIKVCQPLTSTVMCYSISSTTARRPRWDSRPPSKGADVFEVPFCCLLL